MHPWKTSAVALTWLALAVPAWADSPKLIEKTAEGGPTTDKEFLTWAIACETAEVKFADRAARTTQNADVKKLAQQLRDDHTKFRDELVKKARQFKLAVLEGLEKHHREAFARLGKLSGDRFDREYLDYLVEGHQKGIKMYSKWARDAKDADLRDIAARARDKAKKHLEEAKKLSKGRS
jgi:putative membrane protein